VFTPGIATPSDLELAINLDCKFVKFFPAGALGGIEYLNSMAAPYAHLGIKYFPLGGVNADNMMTYLGSKHVAAIGGSWIVKSDLVHNKDFDGIAERARQVRQVIDGGGIDKG